MIPCGKSSNMWRSTGIFCCRDANKLVKDQTHGYYPNHTNHLPLKICNKEVLFVDSFTYIGSLFTNDCSSSRYITSRTAKTASVMCRLSNPLSRKHRISKRTNINMYRALVVSVLLYDSEVWATTLASHISNQSIRESPSNQPHHPSYDNAAYAGSDISTAGSDISTVRRAFDFNPDIHGWKRPRGRPQTRCADSAALKWLTAVVRTVERATVPPQSIRRLFSMCCTKYQYNWLYHWHR